jgi:hypothetical protein
VRNNTYDKVKFEAKEIDGNAGFIHNSVLKIWTNEVDEHIYNILHCHINDMSDSVPIATDYLGPEDSVDDYKEFKTDSAGQILRYKILIQNHKILTVLYNSGAGIDEIPFEEIKLSLNDSIVQVKMNDIFGEDPIIVKIEKLPKSMTSAQNKDHLDKVNFETVDHEPLTHCRNRYFERLPGYVDVRMVSGDNCNSLYEGEYKFSIPACLISP